jgi:hypothetical protein
MLKGVSDEKVEIKDGEYDALWSAHKLSILSDDNIELASVKTNIGVRGINCTTRVMIKNGIVNIA